MSDKPPAPATPSSSPSEHSLRGFLSLFQGFPKAFGQYTVSEQEPQTGKNVGPRNTKVAQLTEEHYRVHLEGTGPGLGIIMLLEDNQVRFAAADVDNYRLDLNELEQRVARCQLPLVLCRTKSGGAHLYLFLKEPVPAEIVRTKLAEWVAILNLSNRTEIFPKQSTRANSSDIGSWINLPYQNAYGPTMRYALYQGQALELDEFVPYAQGKAITRKQLEAYKSDTISYDEEDPLFEAPPCLVTIYQQQGFQPGTSNDGMLAVGVYLKKRYGEEWEQHFSKYNTMFCRNPRDPAELEGLATSLRKKDYYYRCKQPPISAVCQQRACARRKFGVGGSDEHMPVQIESLAVNGLTQYSYPGETDESLWALEMCNVRLMVTTDTLLNPAAMVSQLVQRGRILPTGLSSLSKPKWHKYLEPILAASECLDMSIRTGGPSPFWELIQEILRTARRAKDESHFLEDPDMSCLQQGNTLIFTFSMIRRYLGYRQKKQVSDMTVAHTLEGYGATRQELKGISVWKLAHNRIVNGDITVFPDKDAF